MQCPECAEPILGTDVRCRRCGATVAEAAAVAFKAEMAARRDTNTGHAEAEAYPAHMRIPRAPVASAGPARPAHGGPPPLRPPARIERGAVPRSRPSPPGAGMALGSIICSVIGVVLVSTCIAAPLSVVPFGLGAVFGYLAVNELPFEGAHTARTQAQFGMWIGVGGSAVTLFFIVMFGALFVLGMIEGAAAA